MSTIRSLTHGFAALFLWFCATGAHAATPLVLNADNHAVADISLAPYLALLEDPTQQLGIEQVSSAQYTTRFIPNTAEVPTFGRTRSAWWVRFQVRSNTLMERYLLLDHPMGGAVAAFVLPETASASLQRLEDYRFPSYHLNLPANETVTVYLRVSNGQSLLNIPLRLLTVENFIQRSNTTSIIFTAMIAAEAILALYNLLTYIRLREPANLILSIFMTTAGIMFLRDSNLMILAGVINNTEHYLYTAPFALAMASSTLYWRYVNQGASPILDKFCFITSHLSLLSLPFLGLWLWSDAVLYALSPPLMGIVLVMAGRSALRGHQPTRNAYFSTLLLVLAVSPYMLMETGAFTYDRVWVYVSQIGVVLAMLLISLAQVEQTRVLREAKERAEATSKAKDTFLTTMSHELRTPIHAITGVAGLLGNTVQSAEQSVYLEKLLSSSQHLQSLVDDILDLSRIEAGHLELETTVFRLDQELEKLRQMFSVPAQQKGLLFSVLQNLPHALQVRGDPMRLRQVLVNLLGNAVKFTSSGGITLSVQQREDSTDGYTRLHFEVTDTGIGIGLRQRQNLFQAFTQLDSSTARRYGGTGMGLVISQQLVRLMGGELELESVPEQGSRFFFTLELPVAQEQQPQPAVNLSTSLNGLADKGLHVLLVDDDEMNRYLGEKMLGRLGIKVMLAESGEDALQQLQAQPFDLVMMDVSMPGMDGYTTTRRIREAGYKNLPVIAVTAHAITGERERCLAAGMDDYLTKPFGLEALHTLLSAQFAVRNTNV